MKRLTGFLSLILAIVLALGSADAMAVSKVDLNALTLDELVEKAKADGEVNSVGMPDDWANWGETWQELSDMYGISHTDVDMSSAEELAVFESEKSNATKDIGDVGMSFGPVAVDMGLAAAYKTSYWDSIPDWAKDEEGYWIIAYYGTMSFMVNADLVDKVPQSFEDIMNGSYKVTVGDVTKANQARNAVLTAAIAYGGSESNIQPGLDFFRSLAEQGRLDLGGLTPARLAKGEIAVAFLWDYNALTYRDALLDANPAANFEIIIPSEASIQSGYTTIINAYSKRIYAAALAREFILSDEGQVNLAKGYARPVRDVELPEDVKAKLLDKEQYKNARLLSDTKGWDKTSETLGELWQEQVIAYAK